MANIRPADLPAAASVPTDVAIIVDTGSAVQKATPEQIVDSATPLASEAEAVAGADNAKRMTPLRVKQAMDANMATTAALASTDDGKGVDLVAYSGPTFPGRNAAFASRLASLPDGTVGTMAGYSYVVDSTAPVSCTSDLGVNGLRPAPWNITPFQFGALADGLADDGDAIQAALDYAASIGSVCRINERFLTDYPIYLPAAGCVIDGTDGWIVNNYTGANNQQKLCLIPGNYSAQYYDELTYYACAAASAGQTRVTVSDPSQAANFEAGDIVFVRSTDYYLSSASDELPLYGSFNEVVSVNSTTGVVELSFPFKDDVAAPRIGLAQRDDILDILGNRGIYCAVRPRILGGLNLESIDGNCFERGSSLGAYFEFGTLRSLTGVFTNGQCFGLWDVRDIEADRGLFDFAACSVGSEVRVRNAAYRKTSRSSNLPLIAINENAIAQTIHFGNVDFGNYDYASANAIKVGSATKCSLTIENLNAPGSAGALVQFVNDAKSAPETTPRTQNVSVRILSGSFGPANQRIGLFQNTGGQLSGCYLEANLSGTPTATAVTLAGSNHTIRGRMSGAVSISSATGCDIDVWASSITGFDGTNAKRVLLNGVAQMAAPHRQRIAPGTTSPVGSGTPTITPDFSLGGDKGYSWAGATGVTVANPTNAADGEAVEIAFTNGNGATDITLSWGSAYVNTASVSAITAGNTTLVRLRKRGSKIIVTPLAENYSDA